jgi:hypothetical protein
VTAAVPGRQDELLSFTSGIIHPEIYYGSTCVTILNSLILSKQECKDQNLKNETFIVVYVDVKLLPSQGRTNTGSVRE